MGIHDRAYYRDDTRLNYGFSGSARTAVTTIIIINVLIFFIDAMGPGGGGRVMHGLSLQPNLLQQPWNFWQLLTYGFGHSPMGENPGIFHLFFNMIGLFMFGVPVEQKYGKAEFFRFYLIAIVFSGLVWVASQYLTGSMQPVIGASGAVSAVVVLMAFNFPFREVLLFGIVPIQIWLLVTLYVALDFIGSIRPVGNEVATIAYQAHLGGAAFAGLYYYFHWNFSGLARLKKLNPFGRPRLRVHKPRAEDRLQEEADRVLEKVHQSGESSLTRRERKTLERYSQQMRDRRKSGP